MPVRSTRPWHSLLRNFRVLRVRTTAFVPWRGSDHENLWKVMVRDVDLPVFVCADSATHSHTRLARTSLATLSILNSRRWRCGMTEGSWWGFGHQSFSAVLQHFLLALRHRLRCLSLFPSKTCASWHNLFTGKFSIELSRRWAWVMAMRLGVSRSLGSHSNGSLREA